MKTLLIRSLVLLATLSCCVLFDVNRVGATALSKGDRIRITSTSLNGEFVLLGVRGDLLTVRRDRWAIQRTIDVAEIQALDKAIMQKRGTAMWRNAAIGGLAGAFLGYVVGLSVGNEGCSNPDACGLSGEISAKILGIAGGVTGLVFGAVFGAFHPGSKWEPVCLPFEVGVGLSFEKQGLVDVSVSIPFAP